MQCLTSLLWGRSQTLEYLASTLTAQNVIKHHPETVMTDEWLTVILLECYSVLLFCRSAVLLFVAAGHECIFFPYSDHKVLLADKDFGNKGIQRGSTMKWKLNTSVLDEKGYQEKNTAFDPR